MKKRIIGLVILGCITLNSVGCQLQMNELSDFSVSQQDVESKPNFGERLLNQIFLEEEPDVVEEDPFFKEYGLEHELFVDEYYYDQLSMEEKMWYIDMYRSITQFNYQASLNKEGLALNLDLDKIFQSLLNDNPQLFYVEGYEYTTIKRSDTLIEIEFSGSYTMRESQIQLYQTEIDKYVQVFLEQAPINRSDYEKAKYIYEYIIKNTEYDINSLNNQNICSVFVGGYSVCQGYAKAFMYLAKEIDLNCIFVVGQAGGEGHAWNMVEIEGEYYFVDVTWGDTSYIGSRVSSQGEGINYDYLCITQYELGYTHQVGGVAILPEAMSTSGNYYIKEGLYFYHYDKVQLEQQIKKHIMEGKDNIQIKAVNREVYYELINALINQHEIFELMDSAIDNIGYTQNDLLFTLSFALTKE